LFNYLVFGKIPNRLYPDMHSEAFFITLDLEQQLSKEISLM